MPKLSSGSRAGTPATPPAPAAVEEAFENELNSDPEDPEERGYRPGPITRILEPRGEELPQPPSAPSPNMLPKTSAEDQDLPRAAFGQPSTDPNRAGRRSAPLRRVPVEEEAYDTGSEVMCLVKPNSTFDTHIGLRRYYFVKDKAVRVPQSVRDILARASRIYP